MIGSVVAVYKRWNAVEIDKAREMWRDGLSAAEIGQRLDRGRSSVISKANREGWGAHQNSPFRYQ